MATVQAVINAIMISKMQVVTKMTPRLKDVNETVSGVNHYFGGVSTSAIHVASYYNKPTCLQCLLDANADINLRDGNKRTPLHAAVMLQRSIGNAKVVQTLLDAGADIHAIDKFGNTPLMYASRVGCEELMKTLISAGADVNTINEKDQSYAMLRLLKGYQRSFTQCASSKAARKRLCNAEEICLLLLTLSAGKTSEKVGHAHLRLVCELYQTNLIRTFLNCGSAMNRIVIFAACMGKAKHVAASDRLKIIEYLWVCGSNFTWEDYEGIITKIDNAARDGCDIAAEKDGIVSMLHRYLTHPRSLKNACVLLIRGVLMDRGVCSGVEQLEDSIGEHCSDLLTLKWYRDMLPTIDDDDS